MFKIVKFSNEETEIVPTSWCYKKDDVSFAFFPPWEDKSKIVKTIALRCPHQCEWDSYRIARVFAEAGKDRPFLRKYCTKYL